MSNTSYQIPRHKSWFRAILLVLTVIGFAGCSLPGFFTCKQFDNGWILACALLLAAIIAFICLILSISYFSRPSIYIFDDYIVIYTVPSVYRIAFIEIAEVYAFELEIVIKPHEGREYVVPSEIFTNSSQRTECKSILVGRLMKLSRNCSLANEGQ
jgi:hypothetical protein